MSEATEERTSKAAGEERPALPAPIVRSGSKPGLDGRPSLDGSRSARLLFPMVSAASPSNSINSSMDGSRSRKAMPEPNLAMEWKQLKNVLEMARSKEFTWYSATLDGMNVTATIARGADKCATGAEAAARMEVAIAMMARLRHPHVLPLLGAGYTYAGMRFMVVPAMSLGTLAVHVGAAASEDSQLQQPARAGVAAPSARPWAGVGSGKFSSAPSVPDRAPALMTASARMRSAQQNSSAARQSKLSSSARLGTASARNSYSQGGGGGGASVNVRPPSGSTKHSAGLFRSLRTSFRGERKAISRPQAPSARSTVGQSTGLQRRSSDSPRGLFGGLRFSFTDVGGGGGGLANALLNIKEPLRAALGVARAMDYLQREAVPGSIILHRDLRPDHVMVDGKDGSVRVAGFGRAIVQPYPPNPNNALRVRKDPAAEFALEGEVGAPRYQAPEVALGRPYGGKADVYSFGILAWEVATQRRPFSGMRRSEMWGKVVTGELRPPLSPEWPEDFNSLLMRCWDSDPLLRPDFPEIVAILTTLYDAAAAASAAAAGGSPSNIGSFFSSLFT